jgi:hypothetical protein
VLEGTICKLKCKAGFWSTYNHHFSPEIDVMKQRCGSEICKSVGYDEGIKWPLHFCSSCWSKADMELPDWPGLAHHDQHTWEGIDLDHSLGPWKHAGFKCVLQCKDGYWSNSEAVSNSVDLINSFEAQCSSNNCLKWNWRSAAENPTRCSECFQSTDV